MGRLAVVEREHHLEGLLENVALEVFGRGVIALEVLLGRTIVLYFEQVRFHVEHLFFQLLHCLLAL